MTDTGPFKALSLLKRSGCLSSQPARSSFVAEKIAPRRQRRSRPKTLTDLARCRTVSSEDAADYQHCQKIWAENRGRFFVRETVLPARSDPVAGVTPRQRIKAGCRKGIQPPAYLKRVSHDRHRHHRPVP